MPITKTMAYKVGNETFATFGEAQLHSLTLLFNEMKSDGACGASSEAVAEFALVNSDKLVAILTCKPEDEKPARKPRSDKGTKRAKVIPSPNAPAPYETPPAPQAEAQAAVEAIRG